VLQAQATRCVALEDRQLVTQGENLNLQGGAGPKSGGDQSEKGDDDRTHHGSDHDLTNSHNFCVFNSDGVFGNHKACLTAWML
jgi:hypothetical protein